MALNRYVLTATTTVAGSWSARARGTFRVHTSHTTPFYAVDRGVVRQGVR